MYHVYVIQSTTTGKIYIGQTADIEKRLDRHNGILSSKQGSYTKVNQGIWKLVYKEDYGTRKEVLEREKYLKSHIGRDWLRNTILAR